MREMRGSRTGATRLSPTRETVTPRRRAMRLAAAALAAGAIALASPDAGAQVLTGSVGRVSAHVVSPLLPADHWAVRAAWRAEGLGLVDGFVPAQRAVPRGMVIAALEQAAVRAANRGDPALAALTEGWRRRLAEEIGPRTAPEDGAALRMLSGTAGGGYDRWTGRLAPGWNVFEQRVLADPLPDREDLVYRAGYAAALGDVAVAEAQFVRRGGSSRMERGEGAVGLGPLALSVGREPIGYGGGRGGGVVFGDVMLDRVELRSSAPVRLPSLLRYLGPVGLHTSLSRLDEPRHGGEPYLWAMRLGAQPHPRVAFAINRGIIFGGDSVAEETDLSRIARMFVGIQTEGYENQVVSMDFRFRPPTERFLPLVLYLEWGAEDGSGAWWKVPARVGGVEIPAVPGVPQLSVGAEYAEFDTPCCANPPWYVNSSHRGGWTLDDRPLGHPLGGEGTEWLAYASADLADARLRLDGRAFRRDRSRASFDTQQRAGNLYAPVREGRSTGFEVRGALRAAPNVDVRATLFRDGGDGWTERRLTADLTMYF